MAVTALPARPSQPGTDRPEGPLTGDPTGAHADSPLPPDLAYCLDAEIEMGGLGGDDRAYVDLFLPNAPAWFDTIAHDGAGFARQVSDRHAAWRAGAQPSDRVSVDWAGLNGLRPLMDDCAEAIRNRLGDGFVLKGTAAVLARLADDPDAARLGRRAAQVADRCARDALEVGREAFLAGRDALADLYAARRGAIAARDARILAARGRPVAGRESVGRRDLRAARRREDRALGLSRAMLASLVGDDRARRWASGERLTIEGREIDLAVRVRDVRKAGHGALDVSVTDKSGETLAMLCVYIPDTPALDQVSGLVLYLASGNEDEVLRRANVVIATPASDAHPFFRAYREGLKRDIDATMEDMCREVDDLVAHGTVRNALGQWLLDGPLAPLCGILGGAGAIAALVPTGPRDEIEADAEPMALAG